MGEPIHESGIYIRAYVNGKWITADISEAPLQQVLDWMHDCRDRDAQFMDRLVMSLIGRRHEYDREVGSKI